MSLFGNMPKWLTSVSRDWLFLKNVYQIAELWEVRSKMAFFLEMFAKNILFLGGGCYNGFWEVRSKMIG